MNRSLRAIVLGLALFSPACASSRAYRDWPAPYPPVYSAWEEGFQHGLIDGHRAAYLDRDRPYRRDFWDDPRYRRGGDGYRPQFGSRLEYARGFRAGYERGYFERRDGRYRY
jgi:hypothetical protein